MTGSNPLRKPERRAQRSKIAGPAPHPERGVARLAGIDALRGLGALLVLSHHATSVTIAGLPVMHTGLRWLLYPFLQGFIGVHLFLIVSGFCIHGRAASRDPNSDPGFAQFWRRRLRRLYPPYLAAVLLTLAALSLHVALPLWRARGYVPWHVFWHRMSPDGAGMFAAAGVVHLLMLFPFWLPAIWIYRNPVFWTLALEEHLYLMYFSLPWLRRRIGMEGVLGFALLVTLAWRAAAIFGPLGKGHPVMPDAVLRVLPPLGPTGSVAWMNLGPARWFEWVLGAVAVEVAYGRIPRRRAYSSTLLALGAAAGAMACQWARAGWVFTDALWGIACFVVVNRVVDAERSGRLEARMWVRPLAAVGIFSYSLYLVHGPAIVLFHAFCRRRMHWALSAIAESVLALALAWVFYRVFEVPSVRWSRAGKTPTLLARS